MVNKDVYILRIVSGVGAGRLTASVQVACDGDFYGSQCDVYCVPRDNCTGHYTCDQDTGAAQCLPGWTEDNCTVAAPNTSFCPTAEPYQPQLTSTRLIATVLLLRRVKVQTCVAQRYALYKSTFYLLT